MNNKYTIYDVLSGEIKRVVTTRFDPEQQLSSGEAYVLGDIPDETRAIQFYIKNNQFTERPASPSVYHVWRNESWVDSRSVEQIVEHLARQIRKARNEKLASSDWTQLPDVPIDTKQAWATYRQALRDITSQQGFPTDVVWPDRPQ